MLPSLDVYFIVKDLGHWLIPSIDNDYQRILQFDWSRCIPGHIQQKVAVADMLPSLDDYLHAKNLRY